MRAYSIPKSLMQNSGSTQVQTLLEHLVDYAELILGCIRTHSGHHDSVGGFVGDENAASKENGFGLLLLVKIATTHSGKDDLRGMG